MVVAPKDYPGRLYRSRYVYEHQLVYWQNTGNLVPPGYIVHHKNEDKHDNRFENLELKTSSQHAADHNPEIESIEHICGFCAKLFKLKPSKFRERIKQTESGLLFCGRSCNIKASYLIYPDYGNKRKI